MHKKKCIIIITVFLFFLINPYAETCSNCSYNINCFDYFPEDIKIKFSYWVEFNNISELMPLFNLLICEAKTKKVLPTKVISDFENDEILFKQINKFHKTFNIEDVNILKLLLLSLKNNFSPTLLELIMKEKKPDKEKTFNYFLSSGLYFYLVCKTNKVNMDDYQLSHISFLIVNKEVKLDYVKKLINLLLRIRGEKNIEVFSTIKKGIEEKYSFSKLENEINWLINKK